MFGLYRSDALLRALEGSSEAERCFYCHRPCPRMRVHSPLPAPKGYPCSCCDPGTSSPGPPEGPIHSLSSPMKQKQVAASLVGQSCVVIFKVSLKRPPLSLVCSPPDNSIHHLVSSCEFFFLLKLVTENSVLCNRNRTEVYKFTAMVLNIWGLSHTICLKRK